MRLKMKKALCLLLSSSMMFTGGTYGTLKYPGIMKVHAAETEETAAETKTYTMEKLQNSLKNVGSCSSEGSSVKVNYNAQYQEIRYAIPEEIRGRVTRITCNVKEIEQCGKLAIKVFDQIGGYEIGDEKSVKYGSNSIAKGEGNTVWEDDVDAQSFGLMWNGTEPADITIESVSFEISNAYPEGPVTFTMDELKNSFTTDDAEYVSDSKGSIAYKKKYAEVRFEVPESIQNRLESITFNVPEDTKASLSVKVFDEIGGYDVKEKDVVYGSNSYQVKSDEFSIKSIGLMSLSEEELNVTLESVTFVLRGASKPSIEQEIPDWKDSIKKELGSDSIAGTAIMLSEITDDTLMDLVEKHFNAVTFGNELKPDALFDYQLTESVPSATIQFHGEELLVPDVNGNGGKLNFSRADEMAEKILAWNEANPENKIRIRGHVLVWHSQTQEWFFHENYDINQPYVDKDTMNLRLEWYISSVFDHYFGDAANHKYDDLFYGWDVVNEAVIGNDYRTDSVLPSESLNEIRHGNNSSWWHVYQSNEFIINAFKYANKYAPKNVELYYNDFGETDNLKCEGIVKLIKDVKSAEGTRLDAFGMQAHYNVDGFSAAQFKNVAEKYIEAAGKVQLTELDFKASNDFDGSAAKKDDEYTKMAYCHKQLFDAIKDLNKNGTKVTGLTVWGVIEPNSWLHSQSNVGGGADGSKQCPLLFDGKYKAKPAYWAYVDAAKLQPLIQKITVSESKNGNTEGLNYHMAQDDTSAEFTPVWDKDGLTVQVNVTDATVDDTDAVTVYVDTANSAAEGITPKKMTVERSKAENTENGYKATVKIPIADLAVAKTIGMDIAVVNGEQKVSFNDLTNTQETSSKYYAKAVMKPGIEEVPFGTVVIDGEKDAAWDNAATIPLTINLGSNVSADVKTLWDKENLYIYAQVKDPVLNKDSGQMHEQDSLEIFIDENNGKTASYDDDDKQYRINYENTHSFNGKKCLEENITSAAKTTEDGYVIEAAFKWTDLEPEAGKMLGLELQVNDADATGKRAGTLSWYDETGMGWSKSEIYGTVKLVNAEDKPDTKPEDKPDTKPEDKPGSGSGPIILGPGYIPGTETTGKPEDKPETEPGSDSSTDSDSTSETDTTKEPEITEPDTKKDTVIETNPDGSATETFKTTITTSAGKKVESSVIVSKDADGRVTGASATVTAEKGEFSADMIKQLTETAETDSITITTEVKNANGKVSYTVTADSEILKAGTTLKVIAINKKTGAYELVNAKSYTVDKDGNIVISLPKGADYKLLSAKEFAKTEKAIEKTIAVKKKTATVKKGKSTKIQLNSKLNMNNVKKISYTSTKKSIASVNKSGKISAKKKGTATVKATVTLKNGKKKTVSMKITVK